jgi:hypothetical protein
LCIIFIIFISRRRNIEPHICKDIVFLDTFSIPIH